MSFNWGQVAVSVIIAIIGSSGFWTFIQKKRENKDAKSRMILGLGHDRIMTQGKEYVARGWITLDEYEDLITYLYQPYKDMGGNGSAERLMNVISNLPIKEADYRGANNDI